MTVYASLAQEPTLLFAPPAWTAGYVTGSDGIRYAVVDGAAVLPSLVVGAAIGAGFTRVPPATAYGGAIGTFLDTPTSANLAAAVSDETGSGALVFATSPTLVTPALGTPASGTLTNCTGPWGMQQLAPTVVTSSSQATVDFSTIAGSYSALKVMWTARDTQAGTASTAMRLKINNDGTAGNYTAAAYTGIQNGAAANSTNAASTAGCFIGGMPQDGNTAGIAGSGEVTLVAYATTTNHKRVFALNAYEDGTTNLSMFTHQFRWKSTSAITQLTFSAGGTAFKDGSTFTLYGCK